jgi:putative ABC transport system substrate-binding protein
MRRRDFISALGSAVVWPLSARAQRPAAPIIGYLHSATADAAAHFVTAFRNGVRETGFIEGQNFAVEYRFAEGQYDRLPALAADLVRRQVAVIVASGGDPPALAVKAATATIPIVFISSTDPVKLGLVISLNRPGGNATGVSVLTSMMLVKRLELIRELVSSDAIIAALVNPSSQSAEVQSQDILEAAQAYKQRLIVLSASSPATLMWRLQPLSNGMRPPLLSIPMRSSCRGVINFRRWRRNSKFQRFMRSVSSQWPEV